MAFCKHQGWTRGQLLFDNRSGISCASEMIRYLGMGGLTKRIHKETVFC